MIFPFHSHTPSSIPAHSSSQQGHKTPPSVASLLRPAILDHFLLPVAAAPHEGRLLWSLIRCCGTVMGVEVWLSRLSSPHLSLSPHAPLHPWGGPNACPSTAASSKRGMMEVNRGQRLLRMILSHSPAGRTKASAGLLSVLLCWKYVSGGYCIIGCLNALSRRGQCLYCCTVVIYIYAVILFPLIHEIIALRTYYLLAPARGEKWANLSI